MTSSFALPTHDQFGRPIATPEQWSHISAGIPDWHPRNEGADVVVGDPAAAQAAADAAAQAAADAEPGSQEETVAKDLYDQLLAEKAALDKEKKERERAEMSETERLKSELEEARAEVETAKKEQLRIARESIARTVLTNAGVTDVDVVLSTLNLEAIPTEKLQETIGKLTAALGGAGGSAGAGAGRLGGPQGGSQTDKEMALAVDLLNNL